jgi:hypothetical protein
MVPLRYNEAVERSRARISASALREQFTLADDGWSSRRKVHYTTIMIGAPQVHPETVALFRTLSSDLHGVSIAKGWENLTCSVAARRRWTTTRPGFLFHYLDLRLP